jgi:hypothetical protein
MRKVIFCKRGLTQSLLLLLLKPQMFVVSLEKIKNKQDLPVFCVVLEATQNVTAISPEPKGRRARRSIMKKVLWFSRHELSAEQLNDLERIFAKVEVNQVNKTITKAVEIKDDIDVADVIAIVAPLPLQQEFLQLAKGKPVIFCKNERIVDPVDGTKVTFKHAGWFRIVEIKVVFDPL